jgi:hypothetical protein
LNGFGVHVSSQRSLQCIDGTAKKYCFVHMNWKEKIF